MQAAALVAPIEQADVRRSELQDSKDAIVPQALCANSDSFTRETYGRIHEQLSEAIRQRDALRSQQQDLCLRRRSALLRARAASVRYGQIPPEFVGELPSELLTTYTLGLVGRLISVNRLNDDTAWTAVFRFDAQIALLSQLECRAIDRVYGLKEHLKKAEINVSGLAEFITPPPEQ